MPGLTSPHWKLTRGSKERWVCRGRCLLTAVSTATVDTVYRPAPALSQGPIHTLGEEGWGSGRPGWRQTPTQQGSPSLTCLNLSPHLPCSRAGGLHPTRVPLLPSTYEKVHPPTRHTPLPPARPSPHPSLFHKTPHWPAAPSCLLAHLSELWKPGGPSGRPLSCSSAPTPFPTCHCILTICVCWGRAVSNCCIKVLV